MGKIIIKFRNLVLPGTKEQLYLKRKKNQISFNYFKVCIFPHFYHIFSQFPVADLGFLETHGMGRRSPFGGGGGWMINCLCCQNFQKLKSPRKLKKPR